MNTKIRSPLSRRLIFYIVLCSSAITLFLTVFQLYRDYQSDVQAIDTSFEQIKTVHLKTIELTVWATDKDKLQTLLDGISNLPDIEYVSVDEGGTVISVGEITSDNIVSRSYKLAHQHKGKLLDIGVLKVVANLDSVYSRIAERAAVILISNAIKTTLVVGFMLFIFYTIVTRHLMHIADFVSKVPLDQDFEPLKLNRGSAYDRESDELDQVVSSINDTANRVVRAFSDLLKAEKAQRQSEERFKDIAEAATDWFWEMDESFRFTSNIDHPGRNLPFPAEHFIGRTRWETVGVNPEKDEKWRRHRDDHLAHRPYRNFEFTNTDEDGVTHHLSVSGKPFFDEEGNFSGYRGTATDITGIKEADNALRESEKQFKGVFENAGVGITKTTPDGRFLLVNDRFVDIVGHDREALLSVSFGDITHPEDLKNNLAAIKDLLAGRRQNYVTEKRYICADGGIVWANLTLVVVRDDDGAPDYLLAVIEDTTDQKKAEEALNQSEERFRRAVHEAPIPVIMHAEDGEVLMVSNKWVELSGYSHSDIPTISDWVEKAYGTDKKCMKRQREVIDALYELKEPGQHDAYVTTASGEQRTWEVHDAPLGLLPDGRRFVISMILDMTERKNAEVLNTRLGRIIEQSLNEIYMFDAQTLCFIQANHGAQNNLGYTIAELQKLTPLDIKPEFTQQEFEELIKPLRDGAKKQISFETVHQRKDGSTYDVEVHLQLRQAETPALFIAIILDITDRKQAEEAVRESDKRLRGAVESMQEGFALFDATDRLVAFNKEYQRIRPMAQDILDDGCTFEEMIRINVREGYILEAKGREEEFIKERLELHRNPKGPLLRRFAGGKWYMLNESRTPEGGTAISFIDITERKQAEDAAKASEARLTEILDIAPEAVITVGADMNIQIFNQGAELIFGYESKEVLGQSLNLLMPEHFREDHRRHVEGFDRSGDAYRLIDRRQEIIGLRKDGTEFPASASVSKLEVGGEKIFTVMMQDITERKHIQDALLAAKTEAEAANRAKSEFLAAMSHDLRTPLNAILGFAEILSHQYFGPISDKYREYAEDIQSSGKHLLMLVNEILDLSSIETGKKFLVKEKLSTMEIVRECTIIVGEKAYCGGIELVTKVPKDLPFLWADKRASKQILLNLLSNAIKFTPQGGKITVSAKASKRNTTLKIADTGKGIPAEKLPKLTDPFNRTDTDPYLAEQGWGLGLTITKALVDLHDGKLDIKSKVGKGTTITVTFPNSAL